MVGSLRIVAGRLRGRRIPLPTQVGFRPTADRVREALFSILGDRIQGASVLDAYAGSGALGLEAWSRGASTVLSIDRDPDRVVALRSLHETLEVPKNVSVLQAKVLHWLKEPASRRGWDVILADPPYDSGEADGLVRKIGADPGLLAPSGVLVLERSRSQSQRSDLVGGIRRQETRRYGTVFLDFWVPQVEDSIGTTEGDG